MANPITDTSEGHSNDDLLLIAYMRGAADAKSDARAERDTLQATVKEMREALAHVVDMFDADTPSYGVKRLAIDHANETLNKEQDHD